MVFMAKPKECVAWRRGSMVFEVTETDSTFVEKFVSKKNEAPNMFIRRILKNSKNISGASVWGYLKKELREDYGAEK